MNEKYKDYLKWEKVMDALRVFGEADYDLDDATVEDILCEWMNVCSDLLDEIFKNRPDVIEWLETGK